MIDITQLSKEEREAILNERIEAIRRKNEAIIRRHQEIESDKQNADSLSKEAVVQMKVLPKENPPRKVSAANPTEPKIPKKISTISRTSQVSQDAGYRPARLSEGDLPPADPHFSYLTDRLREGPLCAPLSPPSRKRSTASNSSVASRSSLGSRKVSTASNSSTGSDISTGSLGFSNYKPAPTRRYGTTRGCDLRSAENAARLQVLLDEVSQQQYAEWRQQREQIDRERINRQKLADGNWNREWDKQKNITDEEKMKPRQARDSFKGPRKAEERSKMAGNWRDRHTIPKTDENNNNIIEESNSAVSQSEE